MNTVKMLWNIAREIQTDESGTAMLEWGLLASLIAVAGVLGLSQVGGQIETTFGEIVVALGGSVLP